MNNNLIKISDPPVSVQYSPLPGLDQGCWKVNCETSPFYIPFVTQTVNYEVGGYTFVARKEINLVPWLAVALGIYFIMRK